MDYVGSIYRPPSEAYSMLLQVTTGCSHNKCSFCGMYLEKPFGLKPYETVKNDILTAARQGPAHKRAFLCDGDALIMPQKRLVQVFELIKKHLPWIERVGIYGDCRSLLKKSVSELIQLRELGLKIIYHGVESGDDEVLSNMCKGSTREDAILSAKRVKEAGLVHSVIFLLGIGGIELSEKHAQNSASLLTKMNPQYAAALTTMILPGTPLFKQQESGKYTLPDKFGLLNELKILIKQSNVENCRFSSNHASNYLPVRADLPKDKMKMVNIIDEVIKRADEKELKPEWMRGL